MAVMRVSQVRLAGIASAAPDAVRTTREDGERFGMDAAAKISHSVGVSSRRIAPATMCASDLCVAAAETLLTELQWERDTVQAVIFVSQTPDYVAPATACTLQARLGLSKSCAAFDINLGCSGYVYGLATAAQFSRGLATTENGSGRVLLLVGDTITRLISPDDRALVPLFGDAGSATALHFDSSAEPMTFTLGTDGSGLDHLQIPAGGFRTPSTPDTAARSERENGNIRSDDDFVMNGAEVFLFTLREIPALFKQTLQAAGWTIDDVDRVIMHQANEFILNHLRKRLKLSGEQFVIALDGFGNTSGASIPLAFCQRWHQDAATVTPDKHGSSLRRKVVLAGFGVGWSWGSVSLTVGNLVVPQVVIVPSSDSQGAANTTLAINDLESLGEMERNAA